MHRKVAVRGSCTSKHNAHAKRSRRHPGQLAFLLSLLTLLVPRAAHPQTLARPGWAGSGMTVERWWPHAVLCHIGPESLATNVDAAPAPTLRRLASHMEDLQTLGVDAVLLSGLEADIQDESTAAKIVPPSAAVALDPRYGTLEDFDQLMTEAVRHGIRVLVELHPGAGTNAIISDARFWLSRGVTGLALAAGDETQTRALRGVLHSYIGERILIAEAPAGAPANIDASDADLLARAQGSRSPHRDDPAPTARADQPDLLLIRLPTVAQGAAPMRQALERAQQLLSVRGPLPLLSATKGDPASASAKVFATALLGSGGAVLLAAEDLDLRNAASGSPNSVFAWYRQWAGLHRGNPVMRTGTDTLLNHDGEGALAWVRASGAGAAPIVAICNLTAQPLHLSLVDDIARLHLRGSFLRTVARSDDGMGAMPLRAVSLPPFGVYVGELSR